MHQATPFPEILDPPAGSLCDRDDRLYELLSGGYFFRDLVSYWCNGAILPLVEVLGGMPLPARSKYSAIPGRG
jgi:hypothetical protein